MVCRVTLWGAFGMLSGSVPDRFLVGLAVLGLLSEVAAAQPLLCLANNAQVEGLLAVRPGRYRHLCWFAAWPAGGWSAWRDRSPGVSGRLRPAL